METLRRVAHRLGGAPAAARAAARALRLLHRARRSLGAGQTVDEVLRQVAAGPSIATGRAAPRVELEQAAAAVRRAGTLLRSRSCVPSSIALAALLTHEPGTAVVLGARRDARDQWVAHAWVEVDGVAPVGERAETFQRLASYDRASGWTLRPLTRATPAEA